MRVTVEYVDDGEICGLCGPVVIRLIDGGPTDVAQIDRFRALAAKVLERSPVVGLWIVVHHGSPPPSLVVGRHTRQVFADVVDRAPAVYSMLGIGFWAAAARKAATVLNRMMGTPSPILATVEAGAERIGLELVGLNSDELVAAYGFLFEQLRAHREQQAKAS